MAGPSFREIEHLVAGGAIVRNGCDLGLLLFLWRHPRTLLTSEQVATLVGYPMKETAESLELFIGFGLLDRTQNALHAARMYVLKLDSPQGNRLKRLLDLASTRPERRLRQPQPQAADGSRDE